MKKECSKCLETKPLTEFYLRKTGVFSTCKECTIKMTNTKFRKHPTPKSYKDYLKEAGLLEYVNRTAKYR